MAVPWARSTLELEDRYVIAPGFGDWGRALENFGSRPVAEGFRYTSDGNPEWLAGSDLKEMLKDGHG